MLVRIFGPNLNNQSKGSFHVHAADCADCKKYGNGRLGGETHMADPREVATRYDVVEFVYDDMINCNDKSTIEDYVDDFHFAPCCDALPLKP